VRQRLKHWQLLFAVNVRRSVGRTQIATT
jgi:hypothetical protein